jgi:hypothetical protein
MLVTPQIYPDIVRPIIHPIGDGTYYPIGVPPEVFTMWVWSYKTWFVNVVGTVDGISHAVQGASFQNNNTSNPTSNTQLVLPTSAQTNATIDLVATILNVQLNYLYPVMVDYSGNIYYPPIAISFGTGTTSIGSGTPAGYFTFDNYRIPMYGSIAENTVLSIYCGGRWD